jgi:hypothetical protein
MANTYEAIATVTVGSGGAADIEFTSIPATYTDLLVKASLRSDQNANTGENVRLRFNGSSASVYSGRYIEGNGSSASSVSQSAETSMLPAYGNTNNTTSNTFGNLEIYIPNYTSTTAAKSVSTDSVVETNATLAFTLLSAGLWNPVTQAAITSILIYPQIASNWVQYSTATLYGIKNS